MYVMTEYPIDYRGSCHGGGERYKKCLFLNY